MKRQSHPSSAANVFEMPLGGAHGHKAAASLQRGGLAEAEPGEDTPGPMEQTAFSRRLQPRASPTDFLRVRGRAAPFLQPSRDGTGISPKAESAPFPAALTSGFPSTSRPHHWRGTCGCPPRRADVQDSAASRGVRRKPCDRCPRRPLRNRL